MIYYITEAQRAPSTIASLYGYTPGVFDFPKTAPFNTSISQLLNLSASEKLWRSLNPLDLPFVRLVVPRASIMVLPRSGHPFLPESIHDLGPSTARILLPRLKPLFYLFKVVILPQAVTAGALYGLLLYLLKDSGFLDAQRSKLGRVDQDQPQLRLSGDEDRPNDSLFSPNPSSSTLSAAVLPCAHPVDVDIIVHSTDGKLAISVGTDNSICLWRFASQGGTGTREALTSEGMEDQPIIAALIRSDLAVVVTALGSIQAWKLSDNAPTVTWDPCHIPVGDARVRDLAWAPQASMDPFAEPAAVNDNARVVVAALSDGSVVLVNLLDRSTNVFVSPHTSNAKCFFEVVSTGQLAMLSQCGEVVRLFTSRGDEWIRQELPSDDDELEHPRKVTACARAVIVTRRSGQVDLFDYDAQLIHSIAPNVSGSKPSPVTHVAHCMPLLTRCTTCGSSAAKSAYVLASTSDQLSIHLLTPRGQVFCRCSRRDSIAPDTAPTSSHMSLPSFPNGSSPIPSPKPSHALLYPPPTNGDIPLSSHSGSRRPSSSPRYDKSPERPSVNGHSHDGDDEMTRELLGIVSIRSGGRSWRLAGDKVLGLRRVGNGIDEFGWEIWIVDLAAPWNGQSLLVETLRFADIPRSVSGAPGDTTVQSQRQERLLALNGRIPFPSSSPDISQEFQPLAFVDVGTCTASDGSMTVALGNRLAVVNVAQTKSKIRRDTQTATSPPPRKDRDMEAKKVN